MRFLIVSQNNPLVKRIKDCFDNQVYFDIADNGLDGAYYIQSDIYDLCVIDNNLADIKGFEVLKLTRAGGSTVPTIIIVNDASSVYIEMVLDSGADDCVDENFDAIIFSARVRTLLRRKFMGVVNATKVGDLVIDYKNNNVTKNGIDLNLRKKEFELFRILALNRNKIVSKDTLIYKLWNDPGDVCSNSLEVHMRNLRLKVDKPFKKNLIKTIKGFGYRLEI